MSVLFVVDKFLGPNSPAQVDSVREFVLQATLSGAVNNRTAADVVELFTIPAGYKVVDSYVLLTTAEGSTLTLNIGTYSVSASTGLGTALSSGTDLFSAFDANGTAAIYTASSADALGTVTAADSVVAAVFANNSTAAVLTVFITLKDMRAASAIGTVPEYQ